MAYMDEGLQITVEEVRQQNAKILQLVDLPVIVPLLKERSILSEEIVTRVTDFKHHTQFERSNFLLNFLYQQGQPAIDAFLECLRESKTTNHVEILRLLEGDLQDTPPRFPLFAILDKHINTIAKNLSLVSMLKSLLSMKAISLNTFLDLQNTDRTLKETLERLFPLLEDQGSKGFISFLSCLQKDLPNPGHERLYEILFVEVNKFFKEHPDRDKVSQSDRIEIQQLERREKVIGQEIYQKLKVHQEILVAQINVQAVLPSLVNKQVITAQDRDYLSQLQGETKCLKLLNLLQEKESSLLVKFAESLKESPDNKEAGELLLPSPQAIPAVKKPLSVTTKHEKLAVFAYADHYLSPNGNPVSLEPQRFDQPIREQRETLKRQLESMGFHTHTLDTDIEKDDFDDDPQPLGSRRSKDINRRFLKEVASSCSEDAVVVIFLSGIQFPCKIEGREYRGAILRTNASKLGRLPLDSIESQDVILWVESLPKKCQVTIIVDTAPSHVAAYDKMQHITQVEIVRDPWANLVSMEADTVVFYLKPDIQATGAARGSRLGSPLGMLTEAFIRAIVSCVLKSKEEVSHHSLYEAISFYWYSGKDGPLHKLFQPAIAGDVDRCFPGKTSIPYQQVFRGDLERKGESKGEFLNQITIPVGTMAGLIQGDQLEMFHVLRPGVLVGGHVSTAYQLHSVATVDEGVWPQLRTILLELYKDGELKGSSQEFEFLLVRKKFPLRQRLAVYPKELDRGASNSLKVYIKERSNMLSFVPQEREAKVVVSVQDHQYVIEDLDRDVKYPMRARSIERVKSFLEMVACYKYCKSLKSKHKVLPSYECSLTAARPLLSPAAPICHDFEIYWSSSVEAGKASLGYEAILNLADPPRFWVPDARDSAPQLTVHFKRNRLITAVEFRGDPTHSKYVKSAMLQYNKTVAERIVSNSDAAITLDSDEHVQSIIFKVDVLKQDAQFILAVKIKAKLPGSKAKTGYLDKLRLFRPWPLPDTYAITPSCDQTGLVQLNPDTFIWQGKGGGELTLNLEVPYCLEKIEFVDRSNIGRLVVSLETNFSSINTSEFTSSFPKKYHFPRPIVASNVTVMPTQLGDNPAVKDVYPIPPAGDIRLQLQLHGNIHNQPLDVDDKNLLLFQFNTLADMQLYFYVLCFEETGYIAQVNCSEEEEAPRPHDNIFPPGKVLIEAVIPEEYSPEPGHILDEYHIWVSPAPLCVGPFLQRGVHSYHKSMAYNICTRGIRAGKVEKDEWYDHHYTVKIKKNS